jgi:hypothetical protein
MKALSGFKKRSYDLYVDYDTKLKRLKTGNKKGQ